MLVVQVSVVLQAISDEDSIPMDILDIKRIRDMWLPSFMKQKRPGQILSTYLAIFV